MAPVSCALMRRNAVIGFGLLATATALWAVGGSLDMESWSSAPLLNVGRSAAYAMVALACLRGAGPRGALAGLAVASVMDILGYVGSVLRLESWGALFESIEFVSSAWIAVLVARWWAAGKVARPSALRAPLLLLALTALYWGLVGLGQPLAALHVTANAAAAAGALLVAFSRSAEWPSSATVKRGVALARS